MYCAARALSALLSTPGRLAVIGGKSGAVITRDAVLESGLMRPPKDEGDPAAADDGFRSDMNFCGFVQGMPKEHTLYHSASGFGSVCREMTQRAGVLVRQNAPVHSAEMDERGIWHVAEENQSPEQFDALVLANHDPGFAAGVIEKQMAQTKDPELTIQDVRSTVMGFCESLRGLESQSRFTVMIALDAECDTTWDAAAVHGSGVLQFVCRGQHSSPGQQLWVAHSTAEFAQFIDSSGVTPEQAVNTATAPMLDALLHTLGNGAQSRGVAPSFVQVRRWGNGFYSKTLNLNPPNETHNDAVTFRQLSLAVCGDYLGETQTIQSAALSAMCAANRVVGWLADKP